jgi:HK97 family phage major capsid protein
MQPSGQCLVEMRQLTFLAKDLLAKGDHSGAERAKRRAEELGNVGLSSDELRQKYAAALLEDATSHRARADADYRTRFDNYLVRNLGEKELRDFLSGTQNLTYTTGVQGGFTVPFAYDDVLRQAMAQTDPILDPDVCDFSMTDGPQLQPEQVSGYDLSTVAAQIVGETVQQNPQVTPTVLGKTLNNNIIFKTSFAGSYEAEIDIPDFATKIVRASAVALARKIGKSVLIGTGGTDITGIVPTLGSPTVNNSTSGKVTLTDINNIYFGVNRWYRAQEKCGWLLSDTAYKMLRNATDNQGRPLISVEDDDEELLGKPVFVSPSLSSSPTFFSLGVGIVLFGDLSHIVIRASRPGVQRSIQLSQADITKGQALFIGRARADATLFDPSSGSTPPIVMALWS